IPPLLIPLSHFPSSLFLPLPEQPISLLLLLLLLGLSCAGVIWVLFLFRSFLRFICIVFSHASAALTAAVNLDIGLLECVFHLANTEAAALLLCVRRRSKSQAQHKRGQAHPCQFPHFPLLRAPEFPSS